MAAIIIASFTAAVLITLFALIIFSMAKDKDDAMQDEHYGQDEKKIKDAKERSIEQKERKYRHLG